MCGELGNKIVCYLHFASIGGGSALHIPLNILIQCFPRPRMFHDLLGNAGDHFFCIPLLGEYVLNIRDLRSEHLPMFIGAEDLRYVGFGHLGQVERFFAAPYGVHIRSGDFLCHFLGDSLVECVVFPSYGIPALVARSIESARMRELVYYGLEQ